MANSRAKKKIRYNNWGEVEYGLGRFQGTAVKYVNVYDQYQSYGGPEEGGWYYTTRDPVKSVRLPRGISLSNAKRVLEKMRAEYETDRDYSGRRRRSGEGTIVVMEGHPAKATPTTRPHYE